LAENGYEIMVMLQQSLCATFPKVSPNQDRALSPADAKPIAEAFVAHLQREYQEEMVVMAPLNDEGLRVESVTDGLSSTFVLGAGEGKQAAKAPNGAPQQLLKPCVKVVTLALRQLRTMAKNKAKVASARIFQVLGESAFRSSLAAATAEQSDAFAQALDAAAASFTKEQQEKIAAWTGIEMTGEFADANPAEAEDEGNHRQEDLDDNEMAKQLAELKSEVQDRSKGIAAAKRRRLGLPAKEEPAQEEEEEKEETVRRRPDWTGKAAPDTPAARTPPWLLKGKGKGKGKHPRTFRSLGIASLDESARLHGNRSEPFHHNQQALISDRDVHLSRSKDGAEDEETSGRRPAQAPLRLPKGTPTIAPMCPSAEDDAVADEDLL